MEADRKKDRERKQKSRGLAEPPPLPSALQTGSDPNAALDAGPGLNGVIEDSQPEVLWDVGLLDPLVREAVDFSEKHRIKSFRESAEQAKLSEQLIRQIASDAQFVPAFKSTLLTTAPRALAKTLNRLGVSAKYSDEALCALSIIALGFQHWRLTSSLKELIETKQQQEKQNAERAKQAAAVASKAALQA